MHEAHYGHLKMTKNFIHFCNFRLHFEIDEVAFCNWLDCILQSVKLYFKPLNEKKNQIFHRKTCTNDCFIERMFCCGTQRISNLHFAREIKKLTYYQLLLHFFLTSFFNRYAMRIYHLLTLTIYQVVAMRRHSYH